MIEKRSVGEVIFDAFNVILLIILAFLFLYPLWYVLVASLSSGQAIARGQVNFWPVGFNLDAYLKVFANPEIWTAYLNTIFYVVAGTVINLVLTTLGAYPLSRQDLYGRALFMGIIVFTMFFSGGLIPIYLNIRDLGLYNTRWALLLPPGISAFNLIVMRTFFQTIPDSLIESAKIDGANEFKILARIVLPLSKPVIAVMILFYAVAHWNSWFNALIFLRDRTLFPLQLLLREILIQASAAEMATGVSTREITTVSDAIKYATIIVSTLPVLVIYPFLQKYFVQGVMIGAIKE
jgi:putative aldouronate transport system permease protein